MKNLRSNYSYKEREEFQDTISRMRVYILPLLLERQGNVCNGCKKEYERYQIDHLVYNPLVTINELQALCIDCHWIVERARNKVKKDSVALLK